MPKSVLHNISMICRILKHPPKLLWICFALITPAFAQAAIGGDAEGIAAEAAALNAVCRAYSTPRYDVREIITEAGADIRQYLNRGGVVFAVSWRSPAPPDVSRLLGRYFSQYTAALAALDHPGLHRSVRVNTASLVVEAAGHLRAYVGRAYLPAEVPAGVHAAVLPLESPPL